MSEDSRLGVEESHVHSFCIRFFDRVGALFLLRVSPTGFTV
jgi:hypothetical protein